MAGPINATTLKDAFLAASMTEPTQNVTEKCIALCEKHSITIDDIVSRMEAFLSNNSIDVLTSEFFGKFEQEIHRESSKGPISLNRKPTAVASARPPLSNKRIEMPSPSMLPVKRESSLSTPSDYANKAAKITYRDSPSPEITRSNQSSREGSPMTLSESQGGEATQRASYKDRADSGKILVKMNESLGSRGDFELSTRNSLGMRCKLETNEDDFSNVPERYRYMFTTLEERSRAFEKHFKTMQDAMCELASISPEDLIPIGVPSQDPFWVCGRVCCDSSEGKMNDKSVLLEGSKRESAGRRIQLDLQEMPGFSLFPGQIIMAYGTNSSGRRMLAQKIIEGVNAPLPSTSPGQLLEYHYGPAYQGGKALSVVIASGPFTSAENMDYAPFEDLLAEIVVMKPDVVILTGPFVDITQPILQSGDVEVFSEEEGLHHASYEMVFIEKINRDGLGKLYNTDDRLATHIVLVPSLLDAHHEFVFPQPPFGDRDRVTTSSYKEDFGILNLPNSVGSNKRVHCMPNPCMFRINEVLFGVTSNDALFALSSDEINKNIPGGNRLGRLTGHLLQQQSFAPQYPPPASSQCQLDMRQAKHWQMKVSPDVLVIPSRLTPIVKDVAGSLVINPGQLVKVTSGGSYAVLDLHPLKENDLRDAKIAGKSSTPHSVCERASVQIKKI